MTFRIRRQRFFSQLSGRYPETRIVVWCNFRQDVVEVQADGQRLNKLADALKASHPELLQLGDAPNTFLIPCPSPTRGSISTVVEERGGMMLMPQICEGGFEQFKILVIDEARLKDIFRELSKMGDVQIISKRRMKTPTIQEQFMLSTADLLAGLTTKQSEALLSAFRAGYYEFPRNASMQDIARKLERPRTTMEEHVRKAELKLVTALAPFIALRAHKERAKVR